MTPMSSRAIPGRHRPPADTVLYAVGDVHGRADLLERLHGAIVRDAGARRARRRVLVYLGDYIDRGPDSRGVVARLAGDGPPGFERRFLLGNHDAFMRDFLDGDDEVLDHWLANGGLAALASYGVDADAAPAELRARLARAVPAAHLAFLRALELYHREGGLLFVHAGFRPGVALADQTPEDMIWIRDLFLRSDHDFGGLVVHGHSIMSEPTIRPNRVGIDTGAWRSGTLTAAAFEGDELAFLQT
ncbi:MAG: serine/threonine protein phosphatase [Rhodospirillales bacterium]|nr:serine/threonine protein phosphatase [Rhodospirillales bacterium]